MQDWQKHIEDAHEDRKGFAICGAPLDGSWSFIDVQHAYQTIVNGDRLTPCPQCRLKVLAAFNTPE